MATKKQVDAWRKQGDKDTAKAVKAGKDAKQKYPATKDIRYAEVESGRLSKSRDIAKKAGIKNW